MTINIAILTVSDRCSRGEALDRSGDRLAAWIEKRGFALAIRDTVPDETDIIASRLTRWADEKTADLIVTTGGTGFAPRDVTPEATQSVLEKDAAGLADAIRQLGAEKTPRAVLSRGVAGIRNATLIVNLPGSENAVKDGITVLDPIVEHAVKILRDEPTDHS